MYLYEIAKACRFLLGLRRVQTLITELSCQPDSVDWRPDSIPDPNAAPEEPSVRRSPAYPRGSLTAHIFTGRSQRPSQQL